MGKITVVLPRKIEEKLRAVAAERSISSGSTKGHLSDIVVEALELYLSSVKT